MAATEVIKKLVTLIRVDTRGLKEDAARSRNELESIRQSSKKASGGVESLAKGYKNLTSAIGLAASAFGLLKVVDKNVGMANLATQTGKSVKEIRALSNVFERMGFSSGEATASVKKFSDAVGKAMFSGDFSGLAGLSFFGTNPLDAKGGMRDQLDVLQEMGDKAKQMTRSEAEAIQLLTQRGGLSDAEATLAVNAKARVEYARQLKRLDELGPTIEKNKKLHESLVDQKHAFEEIGLEIATNLAPTVKSLGQGMQSLSKLMSENKTATEVGAKAWIAFRIGAIHPVLGILTAISMVLEKLTGQWDGGLIDTIKSIPDVGRKMLRDLKNDFGYGDEEPSGSSTSEKSSAGSGVLNEREQRLANALHKAESSRGGYNAVNYGKRHGGRAGTENLTSMTVGEVLRRQGRGDFNAVGKYQFIRATLPGLVKKLGISDNTMFDGKTQDMLFRALAHENPKMRAYLQGKSNDIRDLQRGASRKWAGVADPDTGRSYYDGVQGNKATITTAQFGQIMRGGMNEVGVIAQNRRVGNSNSGGMVVENMTVIAPNADANGVLKEVERRVEERGKTKRMSSGVVA